MKDFGSAELGSYLNTNGSLKLGVDVNENASGTEKSTSIGIAVESVGLILQTTAGTFTFTDLYTRTSAEIVAAGADTAQSYNTLFGQVGSNELTSATDGFDISPYDDVLEITGVTFEGEILSADLNIQFLDVADTGNGNEDFFDFTGGFEDFAVLSSTDATTLSNAEIGEGDVDASVSYSRNDGDGDDSPPGSPSPPAFLFVAAAVGFFLKHRFR